MLLLLFSAVINLIIVDGSVECPPLSDTANNSTRFHLYFRGNSNGIPRSYLVTINELNTELLKNKSLIIIISDMDERSRIIVENSLIKAYLFRDADNVIFVEHFLTNRIVHCPFDYIEIIGKAIVSYIQKIYLVNNEITPRNTHLIGCGLGAAIAGHVGLVIPQVKFDRITGLDPMLYFSSRQSNTFAYPLRSSLAEFVDIYHTNLGLIGKYDLLGHVDVYFNNDIHMPGCNGSNLCSHRKAIDYYAETIYSLQGMWGYPCFPGVTFHYYLSKNMACKYCTNNNEMVLVGEYMSYRVPGTYKVITNSKPPYAVGKFTSSRKQF